MDPLADLKRLPGDGCRVSWSNTDKATAAKQKVLVDALKWWMYHHTQAPAGREAMVAEMAEDALTVLTASINELFYTIPPAGQRQLWDTINKAVATAPPG